MKKLLLVFLVLVCIFFINWSLFVNSLVVIPDGRLVVAQGENFSTVQAQLLAGNRAYFPEYLYKVYINLFGTVVKPGAHSISGGSTFVEAIKTLSEEPGPTKVRLPEGDKSDNYAKVLSDAGIVTKTEFQYCIKNCKLNQYRELYSPITGYEGFLFPDTYLFTPNSKVEDVISTLLGNFSNRVMPLKNKYTAFLKTHEFKKVIIMASLLEREARGLVDKRMVAGILYNRLEKGMRLDVDATILYIKGDWKSIITVEDLNNNSPYNTRKFSGLPPGPICNPSLESIEAAMSPQSSNYLYYLTGKNGEMHYATTLEEHVQNKWKFL